MVDVDVEASAGESVAIRGASGSGKTTLLHTLSGLRRPDTGVVSLGGRDIYRLGEASLSALRLTSMGFVFQNSELVDELTLLENVALPLELAGKGRREARRSAGEWMDRLGVAEARGRRPAQVSGGQRQRAAIARAMVHRPQVVFADEPTGALDSSNRDVVLDLLLRSCHEHGALLVVVTHDPSVADRLDRQITMVDGRLVEPAARP